jgi:hypothetical protein
MILANRPVTNIAIIGPTRFLVSGGRALLRTGPGGSHPLRVGDPREGPHQTRWGGVLRRKLPGPPDEVGPPDLVKNHKFRDPPETPEKPLFWTPPRNRVPGACFDPPVEIGRFWGQKTGFGGVPGGEGGVGGRGGYPPGGGVNPAI